jgi:hypothetical protein
MQNIDPDNLKNNENVIERLIAKGAKGTGEWLDFKYQINTKSKAQVQVFFQFLRGKF